MKKGLKITGIVLLVPIVLLLLAAIIVPLFFKDDIKKALDKTIEDYVHAKIEYNAEKISLSIFKDFPNARLGIGDLRIINKAPFQGDTLLDVKEFGVSLDIKSMLTSNFKINGIDIVEPKVNVTVLEDGKASWDIMKPDTAAKTDTSSSSFAISIDHWSIENADIRYDDRSLDLLSVVTGMNHEGSGNIADIIEILTKTQAEKLYVNFGGVTYLNDVKLDAVTNLKIEGDKYTLDENFIQLNDLKLKFNGWTELKEKIGLDMSFDTEQNSFKNLISLVPAVFLEGYDNVEANGTFALKGKVKGEYGDSIIPAFDIQFLVKDGDFKHPSLPKKAEAINFDLKVKNTTGILNNTIVDLKNLNIKMGGNYLKGSTLVEGLDKYKIDTDLEAKVNLAEISEFYPLQGTVLKGLLDMKVKGKGVVDIDNSKFPNFNGYVNMTNGFVKSADFNIPVEQLNFNSTFVSDGTTSGSEVDVKNLSLLLDGDKFFGGFSVKDFDALNYAANLNGKIDLGKLTKIFPIEGTELSGIVDISDFKTKGNMEYIDKEMYSKMETSGKAKISKLKYLDKEYVPYGLGIDDAEVWFTPEKVMIDRYVGTLGKSDMSLRGYISNYLGFAFSDTDTILGGEMAFHSKKFDSNMFFYETEGVTTEETEVSGVYIIPNNINFTLDGDIKELIYDDLMLKDFVGEILIKDGVATMNQTLFKTLGANFICSGDYDTRIIGHPKYNFDLKIQDMPIKEAYNYFNVVKALAPVGNLLDGKFSTNMKMKGELQQDYMPDLKSLNMEGLLNVIEAIADIGNTKLLSGLASATKMNSIDKYSIKNQLLNMTVVDGKLKLSPFVMEANNTLITTQMNRSIHDNSISHVMAIDLPTSAMKSGVSSLGLDASKLGDRVKLNFDVLGTDLAPKFKLKGSSGSSIKDNLKGAVDNKIDEQKKAAEDRAKAELDKAKAEAEKRAKDAEDRARAEAERVKAEAEAKAKAEAEKAKLEAKKKLEEELKKKGATLPGAGTVKIPKGF